MARQFHRGALVALFVCASTMVAYAQAAAPVASATPLDWYVQVIEPLLRDLAAISVPILVPWAIIAFQNRTGVHLTDQQKASVQQAADNAAGRIIAGIQGPVGHLTFSAGDPRILAEVANVKAGVGKELAALGVSDDGIARMITAKLGLQQVQASAGASTSIAAPVVVTEGGATMLTSGTDQKAGSVSKG